MKLAEPKIVYNQTWEDFSVDKELLELTEADTLVALTSGGCNILHAALAGPKSIIAVDANPAQNHLLRLKLAAVQTLPYAEFWQLFGVGTHAAYTQLYTDSLRPALPPESQKFWDAHIHIFKKGLYTVGALARLALLRKWIYRAVGSDTLRTFADMTSTAAQRDFYTAQIEPRLWNFVYAHIPTPTMWPYGVHPRQMYYCMRAGKFFLKDLYKTKQRELFSTVAMRDNFFWHFIFFGYYRDNQHCPDYLKEENFALLQTRAAAITIVDGTLTTALNRTPERSITKFSLSDVVEFLSKARQEALWQAVIRTAAPGALISYRSFAPQVFPSPALRPQFIYFPEASAQLTKREMTASYSNVYKFTIAE